VWTYNDQLAGYSTKFNVDNGSSNKLTFLTVHKAGHEVPTYVPAEALDLLDKFLNGDWFE
jgi:cathepsin A (carboxypeptidase C)/serine carboxypeptidase-like clade 2